MKTAAQLIDAAVEGVFVQADAGGWPQLVATRYRRPVTFNKLRVKPEHGPAGARRMAAGAHRLSDEIESWRAWAEQWTPYLNHVEPMRGQLEVDVRHWRINRSGEPDVGAPYVAAKALLDGLVDAGTLPRGDGPDVVRRLTFHPYEVVGVDGLRVILTTLPGTEQGALPI